MTVRCASLASVMVLLGLSAAGRADTIDSFVGDRDGFNGAYNPNTQALPYRFSFSTVPANSGADPANTDRGWFLETSAGQSFTHVYSVPADFVITSATFEIVTFDNLSEAFGPAYQQYNGRIEIDGVELRRGANQDFFFDAVGEHFNGANPNTFDDGAAERISTALPSSLFGSLLDGSATVRYYASGATGDGVAVDYTRITIDGHAPAVVPLPSATWMGLALVGGSLAPAGLRRWRRRG